MSNKIKELELIGQKFGQLIIQRAWRNNKREILVLCLCDCGRNYQGRYPHLRAGHTKSCGCLAAKIKGSSQWRNWSFRKPNSF